MFENIKNIFTTQIDSNTYNYILDAVIVSLSIYVLFIFNFFKLPVCVCVCVCVLPQGF